MKNDPEETRRRMQRFAEVCRDAGLKLTHQRTEIFREVAGTGDHPGAEAVFRRVRRRVPTMSLDTVYRTLWLLSDFGLVTTLGPHAGGARFDANPGRHHHFVCVRCGLTRDFQSDALDGLRLPDAVAALGSVEATRVEARGVCAKCANKKRTGSRTSRTREADS